MSGTERSELAPAVVAAINARDPAGLEPLLHPLVELRTARGLKVGVEEVLAWAAKSYDHLDRRYAVEEASRQVEPVLMVGEVQYVWRDSGEVGDRAPIALALAFDGGLLRSLTVADTPDAALSGVES